MNNPTTLDRQDVAHSTNPVGGTTQIEQADLDRPASELAIAGEPLRQTAGESLAYTGAQHPNLPAGRSAELRSFEQPVEGAENKLRIDPRTKRVDLAEPGST